MKILKKLLLIVLGVLVISMSSCKKDDSSASQQDPQQSSSKKISKIFYEHQSPNYQTLKTLFEEWNWKEGNLVDYINQYDEDGDMEFMINFSYENGRISQVDCYKHDIYLRYYYDENNMPNKIDVYQKNTMLGSCTINCSSGKIDMLNITVYDNKKSSLLNPITMLLPKPFADRLISFENRLAERNINDSYNYNIQLTWNNGNINKVIAQGGGELITITAQYDTRNCPVYGFLLGLPSQGGLTRNNPTVLTVTENSYSPDTYKIEYQYDNSGYPTKATEYHSNYSEYKDIVYFEYK